jgi:hypothetical protein
MEYAQETSHESAFNLLLLTGPGGFDGTFEDYNQLLYSLEKQATKGEGG